MNQLISKKKGKTEDNKFVHNIVMEIDEKVIIIYNHNDFIKVYLKD